MALLRSQAPASLLVHNDFRMLPWLYKSNSLDLTRPMEPGAGPNPMTYLGMAQYKRRILLPVPLKCNWLCCDSSLHLGLSRETVGVENIVLWS